tara:strand:- start:3045 stop:4775 length:1731 start_codon:yes stop_codon:yes gene_type:complete
MDRKLLSWVNDQNTEGIKPLEIAAAVAREAARQKGLPFDGNQPKLLNTGTAQAPKEIEYTADMIGSVYEQSLDSSIRRHGGVHYTPYEVAKKLVRIALHGLPFGPICDPSVGGGAFLLAAGEYLAEKGASPSKIINEYLWGIDLDQGAIEVARASISIWGSTKVWIAVNEHLAVADSLKSGIESFPIPPRRGFIAVIGNPPFQNQLQEITVRPIEETQKLRKKWKVNAGPYADTAGYFLLVALSMLSSKGKCLLIQPQSILATVDAKPIRDKLNQEATLEGIWIGDSDIFEAGVNVCAPLLSKDLRQSPVNIWTGTEIKELQEQLNQGENWSSAMAIAQGVPILKLKGNRLEERASATAGFRDQFYGLAPHVCELETGMESVAPLITVGMIDPLRSRWGSGEFRYAGKSWLKPVVNLTSLLADDKELYEWVQDRLKPKVLLATQTKVLEVLPDPEGQLIPSTPTISIECAPEDIWKITSALSSAAISAYAFSRVAGSALSSDTIKLSAKQVNALPLPPISDYWEQASQSAQEAFSSKVKDAKRNKMKEMSHKISLAYGCDGNLLEEWWLKRLPKWR